MRIGYVLKQFPKLSETFVLNEMRALERQGAEIHVFAMAPGVDAHFHAGLADLEAPVSYIGGGRASDFVGTLCEHRELIETRWPEVAPLVWDLLGREANSGKRSLELLKGACDLLVKAEPLLLDRLHAHFAGPAAEVARLAAAALNIPYGFTCHAKDIYHDSASPASFRVLHASADRVVTVCEANRAYLEEEVVGWPSPKIKVAYNGVSLSQFHVRNRQPTPSPSILGVGRLVAKKGFNVLIEAAAILERRGLDFSVEIIGDGREGVALREQIRSEGVRSVQLTGAAPQEYVRKRIAESWLVALPCVVDPEGNRDALPTVLLEGLASGVPCVSTPVTGVAEIVTSGVEGLLVAPNDAVALAEAMERIMGDPKLRQEMGTAARLKAESRFDLDRNAATLLGMWRQLGNTPVQSATYGAPARAGTDTEAARIKVLS